MAYSKTHTQYSNHLGEEVPSVTTILTILNKPFLTKWANAMGFKKIKVDDILKESSIIGTHVHKVIEAFLMKRRYIWLGGRHMKAILMMHIDQFINWYKTHESVEVVFMEKKCTSTMYGGTIDFYGKVDGKFTVLDFKTSKKAYASMFLQLAAYVIMLEEMGHVVDQVAIINVREDKYIETFRTREELEPYIECFKQLLLLFHSWYNLNHADGWGDILA